MTNFLQDLISLEAYRLVLQVLVTITVSHTVCAILLLYKPLKGVDKKAAFLLVTLHTGFMVLLYEAVTYFQFIFIYYAPLVQLYILILAIYIRDSQPTAGQTLCKPQTNYPTLRNTLYVGVVLLIVLELLKNTMIIKFLYG